MKVCADASKGPRPGNRPRPTSLPAATSWANGMDGWAPERARHGAEAVAGHRIDRDPQERHLLDEIDGESADRADIGPAVARPPRAPRGRQVERGAGQRAHAVLVDD
jgi:hypothetical protein